MIVNKIKKHLVNVAVETSNLNLPNSLLIIPDGNGRWAEEMGVEISEGHKAGGKTFVEILKDFVNIDIKVLGAWAFSEDNWKRNKEEIDNIMEVIEVFINGNLNFLIENNIKFLSVGKREKIEKEYPTLLKTIENAEIKTENDTGKILVLFLDYGERFQLEEFAKARALDNQSETYELLSKINRGIPLFDMVLRTSGEKRLSGFGPLSALAEFVSVEKNLPDLEDEDIVNALREFSGRKRRFGGR